MACKFHTDIIERQTLMWVGDKDVTQYHCALQLTSTSIYPGDPIRALSKEYSGHEQKVALTSTGYSANTWYHTAGIWVSLEERHVYIEGGSKGSNYDAVGAMKNHDRTAIGMSRDSSVEAPMSGMIAEAAIYDLSDWPGATDSDKADNFEKILPSLAKGFTPLHFPLGLKAYWPLIRGLNDRVGGYNLTASGTVVADHPRVILPQGARY